MLEKISITKGDGFGQTGLRRDQEGFILPTLATGLGCAGRWMWADYLLSRKNNDESGLKGTEGGHAAIQYLNSSSSNLSSAINCCGDPELESPVLGLCGFSFYVCEAQVSIKGSVVRRAARVRESDPWNPIQSKIYRS